MSISTNSKTDWNKCFLCQSDKKGEDLRSPSPGSKEKDGYSKLATNIPLFQTINQLPIIMDTSRLDEGDGIEATLRRNNAKYHENCRQMFSNCKLERARKRAASAEGSSEESRSKVRRASLQPQQCFLCDEDVASAPDKRAGMTMTLNERLKECAKTLSDGKLLARLSGGDIVAQEFKYHLSCLAALYNKERAHLSAIKKQTQEQQNEKEIIPLVFSELLAYIVETKASTEGPVVFKLADLTKLYKERLDQFEIKQTVHPTRLKEMILKEIPELEAHTSGRDVLLAFAKDVGSVLSQATDYSEALILNKAAKILRRQMISKGFSFGGSYYDGCVDDSLPPALLQFVCMIEHGVDIKSQLMFGASKSDQAMAQLLQYNCYAKYREGAKTFRHSKERETPFPVFMGMSIYAKTRKKVLIDLLHDHGLTIPYDRVLEISAQLGDAAVGKYIDEGVVCPSILRKRLFTTAAMDNIDHNPTATTATTYFHGTSVSLFQYPTQANEGEKRESFEIRNFNVKKVPELPETYTNIHPAAFTSKNPLPPRTEHPTNIKTDQACLKLSDETEWLDKVSSMEQMDVNLSSSWPAHHASKGMCPAFKESICSLLPLLRETAHSVATIRHVMDRVKDTVAYLNPGQTGYRC